MTIRIKIIAGFLFAVLMTVFVSVVAIRNYSDVTKLHQEITDKDFRMSKIINELTFRMIERRSALAEFLLTGKTRYLMSYDENTLPISNNIKKAREIHPDNKRYSELIDRYEALITEWEVNIAEKEKEMRQRVDYGLTDYTDFILFVAETDKKGRSIFREMKELENQLLSEVENDISAKTRTVRQSEVRMKTLLIIVAVFSILTSALMGGLLSQHISRGLGTVVRAARAIAAGNLSYRIPTLKRRDETEVMAQALNKMAENLETNVNSLRESEEKYATLVENASDGIVIVQNKQYVFANRRFCEITGYGSEEIEGMDYMSLIAPESREMLAARYMKRINGEEAPTITEGKFICKDGTTKSLEGHVTTIDYQNEKGVLVIWTDVTESREYQENLRRLSGQLIIMQEEERRRISRELHDEIGQALSLMNINVEILEKGMKNLQPEERQKRVEDLKMLINRSIDDIHRISYNLRPYLLDNFGLVSALRWYTETFREQTGMEVGFHLEGAWEAVSPSIETVIYRVAQEALNNVLKHARATRIMVFLCRYPASVRMTIEDNGVGFDLSTNTDARSPVAGGLGIFGIKERLSAYDGVFSIDSTPGSGTRLSVTIPLSDRTTGSEEEKC